MIGWGSVCYIPSFVEVGPLVPGKKILRVFTVYRRDSHLCHVTSTIFIFFDLLVLFHAKFGSEVKGKQ